MDFKHKHTHTRNVCVIDGVLICLIDFLPSPVMRCAMVRPLLTDDFFAGAGGTYVMERKGETGSITLNIYPSFPG